MLNYVWTFLILFGIGTAIVIDLRDIATNKFANDFRFSAQLAIDSTSIYNDGRFDCKIILEKAAYNKGFHQSVGSNVILNGISQRIKNSSKFNIEINTKNLNQQILNELDNANGETKPLMAEFVSTGRKNAGQFYGKLKFEEIEFVKSKAITNSLLEYAGVAVEIALGLVGIMAMWLGIMKVGESAGLITSIARILRPLTKLLFPDIPANHPAVGSMIMNISANMLGLGNAATPFGLKAMQELNELNPTKDTASDSMITFLAINTAGLTLIPASAIAIRAAAGSANPTIIIGTSIFGALCATITGILAAKTFAKLSHGKQFFFDWIKQKSVTIIMTVIIVTVLIFSIYSGWLEKISGKLDYISPETFLNILSTASTLAIPLIIVLFLCFGILKKINLYENFIEGAKEGFNIAIKIIPFLVAMLMAIGIFRASGAMDFMMVILKPLTDLIGFPVEALPMALMRPLSGSGSLGIMTENLSVFGPDSFLGVLVSTIYGSTETTFYVLAVYFGSVNIKNSRYALTAGLLADAAGILGALFIVRMLFNV